MNHALTKPAVKKIVRLIVTPKASIPNCESCVHFVKDDYFLRNIFMPRGNIIGKCHKLYTFVEINEKPKCGGIYYKHYLDRLLD
jgi:hypothetical protein